MLQNWLRTMRFCFLSLLLFYLICNKFSSSVLFTFCPLSNACKWLLMPEKKGLDTKKKTNGNGIKRDEMKQTINGGQWKLRQKRKISSNECKRKHHSWKGSFYAPAQTQYYIYIIIYYLWLCYVHTFFSGIVPLKQFECNPRLMDWCVVQLCCHFLTRSLSFSLSLSLSLSPAHAHLRWRREKTRSKIKAVTVY